MNEPDPKRFGAIRTRHSVSDSRHQKISGGHTGGVTPDPISNSEVKSSRAHGTAGETLWESRSPPGLFSAREEVNASSRAFLFLGRGCCSGINKMRQVTAKVLGDEMLDAVGGAGETVAMAVDLATQGPSLLELAEAFL